MTDDRVLLITGTYDDQTADWVIQDIRLDEGHATDIVRLWTLAGPGLDSGRPRDREWLRDALVALLEVV